MKLDCRDKLDLKDGSTCVFVKSRGWYEGFLPRFNLYDSSDALVVKCRIIGKIVRYLSFTDAEGQELATIHFKGSLPVLHLPDGSEIELNFFRHQGTDFLPKASAELFGATIDCTDGLFSVNDVETAADKQGLLKAVLCFCKWYPKARQREMEKLEHGFLTLTIAWAVALFVCTLHAH